MPHLLWHGASVFTVSPKESPLFSRLLPQTRGPKESPLFNRLLRLTRGTKDLFKHTGLFEINSHMIFMFRYQKKAALFYSFFSLKHCLSWMGIWYSYVPVPLDSPQILFIFSTVFDIFFCENGVKVEFQLMYFLFWAVLGGHRPSGCSYLCIECTTPRSGKDKIDVQRSEKSESFDSFTFSFIFSKHSTYTN